jgi:hypothetical protein
LCDQLSRHRQSHDWDRRGAGAPPVLESSERRRGSDRRGHGKVHSLLVREHGGYFRIAPEGDDHVTRQLYFPDTAIGDHPVQGWYAEEIGLTGEQLGNFPQAFTFTLPP